jgi:hypothetical protein
MQTGVPQAPDLAWLADPVPERSVVRDRSIVRFLAAQITMHRDFGRLSAPVKLNQGPGTALSGCRSTVSFAGPGCGAFVAAAPLPGRNPVGVRAALLPQ